MSSAWTAEDRIRFARNEGVRNAMEFLCVMCLTGGFMFGWIRGYEDRKNGW